MARDESEAGRQSLFGRRSNRLGGSHGSPVNVDDKQFKKLESALGRVTANVKTLRQELTETLAIANKVGTALTGATGQGQAGAAGTPAQPTFKNTSQTAAQQQAAQATSTSSQAQRTGTGMGLGSLRGFANQFSNASAATKFLGFTVAGQLAGQAMGALDSRFDRGMDFAMGADRRSMVYQQMYNMSAQSVRNMRQGPNNYLIGQGGMNAMMDFQRTFGFNTTSSAMARAVEGQRALSGWSLTTGDVMQNMAANLNPEVANRMFMMTGVSPIQIGGRGLTDPNKMNQQLAQRFGLNNRSLIESSRAPGSIVYNNMRNSGMTEEQIQQTLDYAMSNVTYKERGGKGNYDPSSKAARKLMGVEDNLATEAEKTDMTRARRDEAFMDKQYEAMKAVERNTQTMTEILQRFEDSEWGSKITGARAKTRAWAKPLGAAMMVGGAIAMASGVGAPVAGGLMVGGAALQGAGDPVDAGGAAGNPATSGAGTNDSSKDAQIMVPFGYNGGRKSLADVKNSGTFKGMDPTMKNRMLAMMRANPNVGIGGGMRDSEQQKAMFLDRYRRTDKKTSIFWDGSYWEHVKGAAAAPPGKSMHEIGLAADMVGDIGWMNANAGRFGLKHFANVNNEPWHIQRSDLPNSRREYEGSRGTADTMAQQAGETLAAGTPVPAGSDTTASSSHAPSSMFGSGSFADYSGMTLAQIIAAGGARSRGGALGVSMGYKRKGRGGSASTAPGAMGTTISAGGASVPSSGALTGEQVAQLAYQAGFRGDDLVRVVAISKRESGWNPGSYNPNRATQDDSYGLMQINMLGALEAERLKLFGIKSKTDLYDPLINLKSAYKLYQKRNNTLYDWGGYKGNENTYNTDITGATAIVKQAGLYGKGDPTEGMGLGGGAAATPRGASSGSMTIHSPKTITISPVIHFHGTPAPAQADLRVVASEVGKLLRKEVEEMEMRTA